MTGVFGTLAGLFVIGVVLVAPGISLAEETRRHLPKELQQEAATIEFGLGCAVQDRSTERAMAWTSAAMGYASALTLTSPKWAEEFSGTMEALEQEARKRGGYVCQSVPAWPPLDAERPPPMG